MKQFESGRSMVEVLAMLAIAGIIGAGGVGGYIVAMNKHRANELIHETAGRALAVSQQLAVGRKLDEIDFGGYPATDTGHGKFSDKPIPLAGGDFFKIPITGMDQAGCHQLQTMAGGSLRRVDCKDEENGKVTADLIYQKDLSKTAGKIPEDTDGISDGNDSNNTTSPNCTQYSGTSTSNTGGIAGKASDGDDWCRCPSGKAYSETNGCIVACSGHGTLDANEACVCQGGYTGVVCENQVDCGEHGTWTPDKCECTEGWYGPLCDSTCDGWRDIYGNCYPCSTNYEETGEFEVVDRATSEECDRCDNRMMHVNTEGVAVCIVKNCPSGQFHEASGWCMDCSDPNGDESTADFCSECDNTDTPRKIFTYNGKNYCGLKDCSMPYYYRYQSSDGSCYICSTVTPYVSSADECSKCDNSGTPRELVAYNGENYCALTACGTDQFRTDGGCFTCSDTLHQSYKTHPLECARCGNLRIYDESKGICKKA